MKKSLFAMGMLAMAVASCTNEEVVDMPASKGISFNNPYVGTSVRAVTAPETDIDKLKEAGAGFYVFGSYQKSDGTGSPVNVFSDVNVYFTPGQGGKGTWDYDDTQYWAEGEKYKFAAYAPDMSVTPTFTYGTGVATNNCQLTFADVVVDGATANQKDFVVGKAAEVMTGDVTTNSPVSITMKHTLSMVKVTLTNGFRSGVKLSITDFKINNVKTKGTFTQDAGSSIGIWSAVADATPKTDFADVGLTMATNNQKYENSFVMIPQGVSGITVTFTAALTSENGDPIEITGGTGTGKNTKDLTITLPATSPAPTAWQPANRYNYTATIDGNTFGMNEIEFGTPTVDPWGDYSDINAPVDK